MGQSSSKQKHYPFPVPTYPAGYGPPPPFVPPQQYPPPVAYPTGYPQGPYGYVPPGYGQPNTLPQPLLNWLPQDKPKRKRKTTKRANSEQYPTGYVPSESQHRRTHDQIISLRCLHLTYLHRRILQNPISAPSSIHPTARWTCHPRSKYPTLLSHVSLAPSTFPISTTSTLHARGGGNGGATN